MNSPILVIGDVVSGLATHALLKMYPATLFIQYGTIEGDDFVPNGTNEVFPLLAYPELKALEKDGCWDLEEVAALLDSYTTERLEMSDEVKHIIRSQAATAGAVSKVW